jgi:hypothetical protein
VGGLWELPPPPAPSPVKGEGALASFLAMRFERGSHHGQDLVCFDPQSFQGLKAQLISSGFRRHRSAEIFDDLVNLLNIADAFIHRDVDLISGNGLVPG